MTEHVDAERDEKPPKQKRDRTHWLYILVIIGVVAGIIVGLVSPDLAKNLGVLGELFVKLIKMMIIPVIFCTVVLGIGKMRAATAVGKVGGLALGYFLVMSTFALGIGLVVGNLIKPGAGLDITDEVASAGSKAAGKPESTTEFLTGIIPTSLFSGLTSGE